MLRTLRVVLIFALLVPPYRPAQAQTPDSAPDAAAQPPQDKQAKIKELVTLLRSFSDSDYKEAIEDAGIDTKDHPELGSRSGALKTGYTTMAAMEYHAATKDAPKPSEKYQKAYKHVVEDDAASVAVNPETMQETGRFWDVMKIAGKAALKYGLTAALMAVGDEIKSPEEQERDSAISKYEGTLASASVGAGEKAEAHYQLGSTYEQAAASIDVDLSAQAGGQPDVQVQVEAQDNLDAKQQRLLKILNFVQAISDKDYRGAVQQAIPFIPTKGTRPPLLVSRGAALQSTYHSLAALQYEEANKLAPSDKNAQAAQRAASQDAAAAAVDGQNLEQTGLVTDIFKFLGNAAINYELQGGQVYVGRQVRTPEQRKLDKSVGDYQAQLAAGDLSPEKEAALRYKLGQAYEERAKLAAVPESKDELEAKKEARIKKLAGLLQSVSDEDYQTAVKQAGVSSPDLNSKPAALKSAYTTLAGLEYHQASKRSPKKGDYSSDYQRVAGEDAKNLAVNPDTLQETGWFTDLLGVAALGGIGYLAYDQLHKKRHGHGRSEPPPVACPAGTTLTNGRCQPPLKCPDGFALTNDGGCMAVTFECRENTAKVGGACMAACPRNTTQQPDGSCRLTMTCPTATSRSGDLCLAAPTCPSGSKQVGSECVIQDVDCPEGASKGPNGKCVANFRCPAGTSLMGDNCVAPCPTGTTRLSDGSCQIAMSCPQGTTVSGNACLGSPTCPFGWQLNGAACVGTPTCPAGSSLSGGQCVLADVRCPAGTQMGHGVCVAPCPAGSAKNPDGTCKGITRCEPGFALVDGLCLGSPTCPANARLEAGRCVATGVACPAGSHQQPGAGEICMPCDPLPGHPESCRQHWCRPAEPATCVADTWNCPAGTRKLGERCVAACPAGTKQLADGDCEPDIVCPQGTASGGAMHWRPHDGPYEPTAAGFGRPAFFPRPIAPPVALKCWGPPACPPDSKFVGGKCVYTKVSCPAGSRLDSDGDCVIAAVECPAGTKRVGNNCVAPCPDNTTALPNGACELATACADGTRMINGRCVGNPVCQAPAVLTGGRCLLPPECPERFTVVDNRCRPICPAGTTLVDDRCQKPGGDAAGFSPSAVVSPLYNSLNPGTMTIARDSKGNLYLAYLKVYKGRARVFVARSTNDGASWQDTTAAPVETTGDESPGLDQWAPTLAVDSKDVLHLAWNGRNRRLDTVGGIEDKICYAQSSSQGSSWTACEKIPGAPYEGWEGNAQILVDSKDGLHLVWSGQDNGAGPGWRARYSYRPPGSKSWTPYYNIGAQDGRAAYGPRATLDSNDVLSVTAQHQMDSADSFVYASRSASGSWTPWQRIMPSPAGSAAMAADAQNNIHVAWGAWQGGNHVGYARRDARTGAWVVTPDFQPEGIAYLDIPSLAVDAKGNVYLAWISRETAEQATQIRISRFDGRSWSAWTQVAANDSIQHFPTLRWSERNGNGGFLSAAWTEVDAKGNATVRYAQNPSVAMAGAAAERNTYVATPYVATGRGVGSSDSIDVLEEDLASDELTAEQDAQIHHQLGAAYEKLAMVAGARVAAPEVAPEDKPKPQAKSKPETKARPKARPKPEQEEQAEEPPRRHVRTAEEQREADMQDLDEMGKKMSEEVEKRAPAPAKDSDQ